MRSGSRHRAVRNSLWIDRAARFHDGAHLHLADDIIKKSGTKLGRVKKLEVEKWDAK
jgi:hypothetical protein